MDKDSLTIEPEVTTDQLQAEVKKLKEENKQLTSLLSQMETTIRVQSRLIGINL